MSNELPVHPGLYRKTIGANFDSLPVVLRRFHDEPAGAKAQGVFRITRGQGRLRNAVAAIMRLPPPGDAIPIHLEVRAEGGREQWIRHFGSLCLATRQWEQKGLLIEAAGPLRFGFRLVGDAGGMEFQFARCWLFSLPLPAFAAPRVTASVQGRENGWHTLVQVEVPLLGMITRYEGELTPLC